MATVAFAVKFAAEAELCYVGAGAADERRVGTPTALSSVFQAASQMPSGRTATVWFVWVALFSEHTSAELDNHEEERRWHTVTGPPEES